MGDDIPVNNDLPPGKQLLSGDRREQGVAMDVLSFAHESAVASNGLLSIMRHHPLASYFLLTFALTWLGWAPIMLAQGNGGLGLLPFHAPSTLFLIGGFGPCASGFIMSALTHGKAGVRDLLRRLIRWRVGWQWYLFAILGIPAIGLLGFFPLPGIAVAVLHNVSWQFVLDFVLFLMVVDCIRAIGEEPGWRGFALPWLQQRYGPLLGTLILGVFWAGWHLPFFLIPPTSVGATLLAFSEYIVATTSLAIVITWVHNSTRASLMLPVLIHAAVDAYADAAITAKLFPATIMPTTANAALPLLIGFGPVALLMVLVTRGRLGFVPGSV